MSAPAELSLRFPARAAELAGVRRRLRRALAAAQVAESIRQDVVLAVDEACQNIIRHCYQDDGGEIVLELRLYPDRLELLLIDFGPSVDPAALEGRDLDDVRPGGLGIHLIRGCMDEVGYDDRPAGSGNRLRMIKRLR